MPLSIQQAKKLITQLKEKEISLGRAPETWFTYENHVYGAADVAKKIASRIKSMDQNRVYVAALLHDVCRTEEDRVHTFHGILGYQKLIQKDELAARSALLHSFHWGKLPPFKKCSNLFYGCQEDYDFVSNFIQNNPLNDVDLLIQLSDLMANKNGIVTINDRMIELAERGRIKRTKSVMQLAENLKHYFDDKIGQDVYDLFF